MCPGEARLLLDFSGPIRVLPFFILWLTDATSTSFLAEGRSEPERAPVGRRLSVAWSRSSPFHRSARLGVRTCKQRLCSRYKVPPGSLSFL